MENQPDIDITPKAKRSRSVSKKVKSRTDDLLARFKEIDFDPIDCAVMLIQQSINMSDAEKAAVCLKLAEFVYPKRKSIEFVSQTKEEPKEIIYEAEWGNRAEVSDEHDGT
jgi:hypothetical protein